jgi:hypothetical protein
MTNRKQLRMSVVAWYKMKDKLYQQFFRWVPGSSQKGTPTPLEMYLTNELQPILYIIGRLVYSPATFK